MPKKANQTYYFICFTDLIYEFTPADKTKVEIKIKRRLKYYQLGAYDQEKVEYIRRLKNELYKEISKRDPLKNYNDLGTGFAELNDFNIAKMLTYYNKKYSSINKDELAAMINFAIYLFHMR